MYSHKRDITRPFKRDANDQNLEEKALSVKCLPCAAFFCVFNDNPEMQLLTNSRVSPEQPGSMLLHCLLAKNRKAKFTLYKRLQGQFTGFSQKPPHARTHTKHAHKYTTHTHIHTQRESTTLNLQALCFYRIPAPPSPATSTLQLGPDWSSLWPSRACWNCDLQTSLLGKISAAECRHIIINEVNLPRLPRCMAGWRNARAALSALILCHLH